MGILYVVATPIGNLGDITYRAVEILNEVDLIACEDTRQTKKLLDKYSITTRMTSCHQYSKLKKISYIIDNLKNNKNVALVSDAGIPAVSDPGSNLILQAIENRIKVVPIPGVSASTALFSICGTKGDSFLFLGFLPKKKGRKTLFEKIKANNLKPKTNLPIIIFESRYRVLKTLNDFAKIGNFHIIIGRELTKKFEQIIRGDINEVIDYFEQNKDKLKGEFTLCLIKQE